MTIPAAPGLPPFPDDAAWIWDRPGARGLNRQVCFRRVFAVNGDPRDAVLELTADCRYELFVNGVWLGFGPVRSWPRHWFVDRYDLRAVLRPGVNVVAVAVHEVGIGTFQYFDAAPGLLASLRWTDAGGAHTLSTGADWRCRTDEAYVGDVPRISCQQGWEEQYDARRAPGDWTAAAFDDSAWPMARVAARAGEGDHPVLAPRPIPFLSRTPLDARRLVEAHETFLPPLCVAGEFRECWGSSSRSADYLMGAFLAGFTVHSPKDQDAVLWRHNYNAHDDIKVNGQTLAWNEARGLGFDHANVATFPLRAGANRVLVRVDPRMHSSMLALAFWTEAAPTLEAAEGKAWTFWGPFPEPLAPEETAVPANPRVRPDAPHPAATPANLDAWWNAGWPDGRAADALAQQVAAHDNIGTLTMAERPYRVTPDLAAGAPAPFPRPAALTPAEAPAALLTDHADWTGVPPAAAGADGVRLLLDFGVGTIGFVEFEIDAPEGTVVDALLFELIQADGRRNLPEGMNNGFRYVAREGVQRFRSRQRRGGRYLYLSFRRHDRPVRVRHVRLVESLYPQDRRGTFACADARLDRIWDVAARSVACCSEDAYTDCPTYEQTFWVGDARNESMVDLAMNGDPRLSRHGWLLTARSLEHGVRTDFTNDQVPSAWTSIIPAWTFLWMRWGEEHWRATGDDLFGREALGWLARQAEGLRQHLDSRDLFDFTGWNMFDWAPMDTPGSGIVTHQNCLAVQALRQTAAMADELDSADRAAEWRALADRIAAAVNRHLWDEEAQAYIDCIHPGGLRSTVMSQQTHTAAFLSGVAEGARRERSFELVMDPPAGFVTAGSPFFMFFFVEILAGLGRVDEMARAIVDYWNGQAEAGATTFWEMYHPDAPRVTRSHCHGWSAAPAFFLTRHVLGVHPEQPGYKAVRIAPRSSLAWCRGTVPTPGGTVECRWERRDGALHLEVAAPEGVPVTVDWGEAVTVAYPEGARHVVGVASPDGTKTTFASPPPRLRLTATPHL